MGRKKDRKTPKLKPSQGIKEHETMGLLPSMNRVWLAAFFAAALTLLIYLPALNNDFVRWDDHKFVFENKHITSIDLDFIKWIFFNRETQWSPLRWLSHAIDYQIWGLNPKGHHLSNIILHGLNTFLVVILVVKLLEVVKLRSAPYDNERDNRNKTFGRKVFITSIVTGIFFGIHPLQVESVAWVSARKDVLCSFFFLISLLCYLKYVSHSSHDRKRKFYYSLCLVSFALALMGKAMAITLPFVLILLDIYPLRRGLQRNVLIEKLPFLFLSLASVLIGVSIHEEMGAVASLDASTPLERILVASKSLSFYLLKTALPYNLAPFHPYPSKISFFQFEYWGSLILTVALTVLCIYLWKRGRRIWLTVWLFFVLHLLPVPGIFRIGGYFAAERYTYIPSIGVFLLAGLGVSKLWERKRIFILCTLVLIISVLSIITIKQIAIWRDSLTLWSREVNIYPDSTAGYEGRGKAYEYSGEYQKALRDLDIAIKYNNKSTEALKARANVYVKLGDSMRALMDLDKAIEIAPQFAEAYGNRCGIYMELGDYQKAIKDCSKALEIKPEDAIAYNNRGFAFNMSGEFKKSIEDYSQAIALNPKDPGFYRNRGTVYFRTGKNNEAMADFQMAARLGDRKVQELLKKRTEKTEKIP